MNIKRIALNRREIIISIESLFVGLINLTRNLTNFN